MLETSIRKAKCKGVVAVEVATAQKPALLLYRKLGFTQFTGDFDEVLLGLDLRVQVKKEN